MSQSRNEFDMISDNPTPLSSSSNLKPPLPVLVKSINFSYGNNKILTDVDLEIPTGCIQGLLGSNGAGKTTLINLLVGKLKPNSGLISIFGVTTRADFSNKIGYMPQKNALYETLTTKENIDFFARMQGIANKKVRNNSVEDIIEKVKLTDTANTSVSKLSGGMKQRVSLAISLINDPDLLFMDEPTVGLDPELRAYFWNYFQEMSKKGKTLIISTHTMDDAVHCEKLGFMKSGRIIANDSPVELLKIAGKKNISLEKSFLHLYRNAP